MIVSPRLGGRDKNFNRGNEILESRLWRVPGARPFPSARSLSAERLLCQCLIHYILVRYDMLCYILLCCTMLQYVIRNILSYVCVFLLYRVIFDYVSSGYCVTSWFRFCYVVLFSVMFSYMLFHLVRLYYVMLWYISLYSLLRRNPF